MAPVMKHLARGQIADVDGRDREALGRHRRDRPGHSATGLPHPAEIALLSLQRMAGNAAVDHLLAQAQRDPLVVQRCGPVPCGCTDEERAVHLEAGARSVAVQREPEARVPSQPAQPPVFLCAKPLATSPVGNHAFFRIGGRGPGNHTIELEPREVRPGCYQGIPQSDFPEDVNSNTTNCRPVPRAAADIEAESSAYPRGYYCTFGPNSNTFIGVLARRVGAGGIRPSGWLPGFDADPPPAGTFAPSPWVTLFGCKTKDCPSER